VLLGATVAALLIVWARTAYVRRAWDKRLTATRADVEWFEGPLAAHVFAQPTPEDADVAWQAGRPQVVDIERALYDLHGDAKTATRAAKAADGQRAVRELTAAFDADTSSTLGHDDEASLRAGRAAVEAARAQVRAWLAATAKG
jgi:hypothetical protein